MKRRYAVGFVVCICVVLLVAAVAHADALDDAGARMAGFIQKAGNIVLGLGTGAGTLALGGIGIRRMIAKSAGEDEVLGKTNQQILEVLKYMAIVGGAGLLASIGGSILK